MNKESERDYHAAEKSRLERELAIKRQIAFATGLFQKDITIRTLLESLAQGVFVVDSNGNILLMNARAEQMFGYSGNEIIGRHHDILLPERMRVIHRELMAGFFKEPRIRPMGKGLDLMGIRKDGEEFSVEISLSHVKIQDTLLILALVTDITQRVEAQRAIKQRAEELAEANSALESFAFSVSHDLRTPLHTLIVLAAGLQEEYSDKLGDEGRTFLERIIFSGNRMNELIDDMLALSMISRHDITMKEVDITEIAESVVSELRQAEPYRKAETIIQKQLKVMGDPKLIHIALSNLIGNAWKYTGKVEHPRIEIGAMRRKEHTTFFVRDNGVGFDMQYASKLFSPFQRLHPASEYTGTGIGLAIAARVISRHHGRIWAKSVPGKGAIFFFELD